MIRRFIVVCSFALPLLFFVPASVYADAVLVLDAAPNPVLDEGLFSIARDSLKKTLASYGFSVIDIHDESLKKKLSSEDRACSHAECADDAARSAGCDAALSWTIWSAEDKPISVALNLITRSGAQYSIKESIKNNDLKAAAREAAKAAIHRYTLGSGPFLKVDGTQGARLLIDAIPSGILPYHKAISAGSHSLRVELKGYETFQSQVHLPKDKSFERTVSANLQPIMQTHYPWLASGLLVGAGAVLTTIGAIGLAQGTSCDERDPFRGSCLTTSEPNAPVLYTALGIGAASIAAGVIWFFIGQYRTRAPTEDKASDDIQVNLTPTSLELRGTF